MEIAYKIYPIAQRSAGHVLQGQLDVDGDDETADAEIDEPQEPGWSGDDENPR